MNDDDETWPLDRLRCHLTPLDMSLDTIGPSRDIVDESRPHRDFFLPPAFTASMPNSVSSDPKAGAGNPSSSNPNQLSFDFTGERNV